MSAAADRTADDLRRQAAEHLRRLAFDGLWGMPRAGADDAGAKAPATVHAGPDPVPVPSAGRAPASGRPDGATPTAADPGRFPGSPGGGLGEIEAEARACTACRLCETRTNVVFGVGDPAARLMFIGEGPGRDEDLQGEPFVGAAGQLLDRIIVAMGLGRSEVYIANTVKCRPPRNRNPEPDEMEACRHFLMRQVEAIRPEVIVLLGRIAAQAVLESDAPLGRLRGRFVEWRGIPVMCTYHPAYLLRNPADKRKVWEDIQQVMARLGLQRS